MAQIFEVAAVFGGLGGVSVDDRQLAGLCDALGLALDQGLVDPLLDDLVPDVVRAVDVEPLLVEAEAYRQRRVLDEHQVRGLERHRQLGGEAVGTCSDAARDHQLPDAEALEVERIEATVLHQRSADVDLMVDTVGLLLFEVVRIDVLRRLFLEIEVRRDRVRDAGDAFLEDAALAVHRAEPRIERASIRLDGPPHGLAEGPEMIEQRLYVGAQEGDDPRLIPRRHTLANLIGVPLYAIAELVERRKPARLVSDVHDLSGEGQLREQVGLDRALALHGRASDIRERVQWIDVFEDDRPQRRRSGSARDLQ